MPSQQDVDETTQTVFSKLPPHGVFVGRTWELAQLKQFLSDQSPDTRRIMLVHGPRGIGKSALVREAAQRGIEENLINTAVWLDRTRVTEILSLEEDHIFPFPQKNNKLDIDTIIKADSGYYTEMFRTPKQNSEGQLSSTAVEFLKELLKNEPFLLIIDDFDEYDGLGDEPHLCEQMARIRSPNKIILTTRKLEHKFSQQVFKSLEVGLLDEDEVKYLVQQCGLDHLEPLRLVNGNVAATADYLWQVTGGLSEFIVRFLMPMVQQREWLLEIDPRWSNAFVHFSAGYLIEREQEKSFEWYENKASDNIAEFLQKFQTFPPEEKYLLLALANQEEVQALNEKDLAHALGYPVEDQQVFIQFHEALHHLYQERLVSRRLEGRSPKNSGKEQLTVSLPRTWLLLPFIRVFIENHVLNTPEAKIEFQREQADRWINFVESYRESPQQIKPQLDKIYTIFSWCLTHQEWQRLVGLGRHLSPILWELGFEQNSQHRDWFINICQETAQAARQPEIDDWQIVVEQWLLLALLCSESKADSTTQQLARNYVEMTLQYLEHQDENEKTIVAWGNAVSLLTKICLQNNDLTRCQQCLEQLEANEQYDCSEWTDLAYQLAKQYLHIDAIQAQYWLEKIIDIATAQDDFATAAQAGVDLAHLHLLRKEQKQAIALLQRAKMTLEKASPTQQILEVQIKIITIEAQMAYHSEDIETCQTLLNEGLRLAKDAGLYVIKEELDRWLNFVVFSVRGFDPTSRVDKLLGNRLLWGILEEDQACPICRRTLTWDDFFEGKLWLCPNCNDRTHLNCMQITDNHCPSCEEPRVIYA